MTNPLRIAIFLSVTTVVACSSDDDTDDHTGTTTPPVAGGTTSTGTTSAGATGTSGTTSNAVTYYGDVAPIFADHCVNCHVAGGIGTYAIDDYEEAKLWANSIAQETGARTMPPFNMNNDGTCHTFGDDNWLTDAEIDLIRQWADGGALEGDASLAFPDGPVQTTLSGSDIQNFAIPADYQPLADGDNDGDGIVEDPGMAFDDYQCFKVPLGNTSDTFITGFEVHPDKAAQVHHVVVFKVDRDRVVGFDGTNYITNDNVMDALDSADTTVGWDCDGSAGTGVISNSVPVAWAPGTGATNFPTDTGIRVASNEVLVFQVHYNLVNGAESDSTTIDLALAPSVLQEGFMYLDDEFLGTIANPGGPDTIPPGLNPGDPGSQVTWTNTFASNLGIDVATPITVHSVLPHMHKRGTDLQVELDDGVAAPTCGADVDRWDFNWQFTYWYDTPIETLAGTEYNVTCTYDTTGESDPVAAGFGTGAEMCLIGWYVTID